MWSISLTLSHDDLFFLSVFHSQDDVRNVFDAIYTFFARVSLLRFVRIAFIRRTKQQRQQQQQYITYLLLLPYLRCNTLTLFRWLARTHTQLICDLRVYFVIINVTKMQKKTANDVEEVDSFAVVCAHTLLLSIFYSYYLFTLSHLLCGRSPASFNVWTGIELYRFGFSFFLF